MKYPTFAGAKWAGRMLDAAQGCKRSLNVHGLDSVDLRTGSANGSIWDAGLVSGKQEARKLFETLRPALLIAPPPSITYTPRGNQFAHLNVDTLVVTANTRVGRKHVHVVASACFACSLMLVAASFMSIPNGCYVSRRSVDRMPA